MLRIEEIVGAMDDEFRYSLDALSDDRLAALLADKTALRRLRPVGVSTAEAQAMITAILERRARPPAPVKPKPARPRKPRPPRQAKPKSQPEAEAEAEAEATAPAAVPASFPALLPAADIRPALPPPSAHGPAIRLGAPPPPATAIILPPPPAPRTPLATKAARVALASPVAWRHLLLVTGLCAAVAAAFTLL